MSTGEDFEAKLRTLTDAQETALTAATDGVPDLEAYHRTTAITNAVDKFRTAVAGDRAERVARIWEAQKLSLAQLAGHIGLSRARADQFLRAARPREDHDGASPPDPQRPEGT